MTADTAPAILIVEDERIVARDLQQALRALGYDPYAVASSADEAVAKASQRCPDLVLMDIRIKGDRDGIETAALLRERFLVPVVFLTAHADDTTLARAKTTVPHGYLLKPVRTPELRSTIEVALYRHEMEKRLRERERWFSTTLRSIGDAVITVDLSGKVTFMNHAAELLTGNALPDSLGRPAREILKLQAHPSHSELTPLERALRDRRTVELQEGAITGTGDEPRIIADSAAPVIDEGELLGAVMVFRDVTEQKNLQQRIELADRLASLGTMAAGVAHEANNPLAIIVGNASLLAEEVRSAQARASARGLSRDEVDQLLSNVAQTQTEILSAAARIQRIVADLKTFSRPELHAAGEADVSRAFDWAARATAPDFVGRAHLSVKAAANLCASIDELRLGQVLVNLLINAAQAMPQRKATDNQVELCAFRADSGRIVIEVRDNGPGIPVELRAKIFEPFFTTKPLGRGTGLGLSICHGIVKQVGGELEAECPAGGGTTFRVVLPAVEPTSPQPAAAALPTDAAPVARILVVDDEEALLRVVSRILREHEVVCARDGQKALALIEAGQAFDVIICDLMMPIMTGIDLYETLLDKNPELARRMVFVSGGATGKAAEFRRSVRNAFLDKPFSPAALHEVIRPVLRSSSHEVPAGSSDR